MSTVSTAFEKAAAEDRAALVGYLPAGFPDKQTAIKAAVAMVEAGADVIEVGLPYSDPLMDGPVIADAVYRALAGGAKIKDVFDTVQAVADAGAAALVMTYWNPVDKYGADAFSRDLASAGRRGPDHPGPDPGGGRALARGVRRPRASTASSLSPRPRRPQRVAAITSLCRGFVYAVSLMGITGARDAVSSSAAGVVARIREHTALPGRRRPRRLHRRPGQAGRRIRRRRDRRLRLRPPDRRGRHPGRRGRGRPRAHRRPGPGRPPRITATSAPRRTTIRYPAPEPRARAPS